MIVANPLNPQNTGSVPTSRTVNGKALSANITLTAADVGARSSNWTPTAGDVGAPGILEMSNMSLAEISEMSKAGAYCYGRINWDSAAAPDNNNTIILMTSWLVMAISFSGKIFTLDLNENKWIAR